jgi:hypothetical protein
VAADVHSRRTSHALSGQRSDKVAFPLCARIRQDQACYCLPDRRSA